MQSKSIGLVTTIGAATSRPKFPQLATRSTDFAIEVQMLDGDPVLLELSQSAAHELAAELTLYLHSADSAPLDLFREEKPAG